MRLKGLLSAFWLLAVVYAASPHSSRSVALVITNRCTDTIWPGIATQSGNGPESQGFELLAGATRNLTVATDWNGRVWGRTNCTFTSKGTGTCGTGDCGGVLNCAGPGAAATLAEFNLPAYMNQSFYDISLVDGYNLPLAIQAILNSSAPFKPPPNETNPSCIGSAQDLASTPFNPYTNNQQLFLGTSSSNPLPFDNKTTTHDVSTWCPSDLSQNAPNSKTPPPFNPCLSACQKYNLGQYCCTGKYKSAKKCKPNFYSAAAKKICPDAYSYAFDDASSTFAVPTGSGFEIVFCPGGRSTIIQKTLGKSSASSLPAARLKTILVVAAFSMLFIMI